MVLAYKTTPPRPPQDSPNSAIDRTCLIELRATNFRIRFKMRSVDFRKYFDGLILKHLAYDYAYDGFTLPSLHMIQKLCDNSKCDRLRKSSAGHGRLATPSLRKVAPDSYPATGAGRIRIRRYTEGEAASKICPPSGHKPKVTYNFVHQCGFHPAWPERFYFW